MDSTSAPAQSKQHREIKILALTFCVLPRNPRLATPVLQRYVPYREAGTYPTSLLAVFLLGQPAKKLKILAGQADHMSFFHLEHGYPGETDVIGQWTGVADFGKRSVYYLLSADRYGSGSRPTLLPLPGHARCID